MGDRAGSIPVIRTQKPLNFRGFLCLCCIVVKNDYLHYILDFFGIFSGIVIEYLNKKMYFFCVHDETAVAECPKTAGSLCEDRFQFKGTFVEFLREVRDG